MSDVHLYDDNTRTASSRMNATVVWKRYHTAIQPSGWTIPVAVLWFSPASRAPTPVSYLNTTRLQVQRDLSTTDDVLSRSHRSFFSPVLSHPSRTTPAPTTLRATVLFTANSTAGDTYTISTLGHASCRRLTGNGRIDAFYDRQDKLPRANIIVPMESDFGKRSQVEGVTDAFQSSMTFMPGSSRYEGSKKSVLRPLTSLATVDHLILAVIQLRRPCESHRDSKGLGSTRMGNPTVEEEASQGVTSMTGSAGITITANEEF
ncbi:hypothetical protein GE21DRAFT_5014 [Neurospora crassa]|uniref:Uncharacterized protein n=1 Tax=Neurospora crassa (strain ATCC 24698 / 74-OR23-1A / CBS 708.71 / DSM 1257 / FGSC 987) TaxID=367110 RepID=U9WHC0_NEUCR|nr:hypothetical protein NCU16701 [Neurospora crassa OR74A]ESA43443.1 hypothetical protein NCU16701 [Neurospora crassa OR74A]KHE86486.1 hypothetical protein GE21DRAFT_5014 [Neurospora crassa]|eukprot:XP_011394065.1 hypothetical protein NCU16701 [Neurospora crassa OR74A]